jgi:hypothetical protein
LTSRPVRGSPLLGSDQPDGGELIHMNQPEFSIAVFPFLKTRAPLRIGGYTFRATTDTEGLPLDQARAVSEIAQMLFVQDEFRVTSASYAILPDIQVHSDDQRLSHLYHLREVVAYFYSAPHDTMETVFLAPEEVSLVLLTPARVSVFLTRPEHGTKSTDPHRGPVPDNRHYVPGYNGLYNFRHAFWVEPGSRLYGPKPHMGLNLSQDLAADLGYRFSGRPDYHLLLDTLEKPLTPTSQRIYAALHWYNAANEHGLDHSQALLNLAVAFETLLRLPEKDKKDRLVDAISLLLGRTERLDDWADQFYAARSRVAHEGQARDGYFYASGTGKHRQVSDISGSLMLYGRQIFQLCVGTILGGIDLAERADLEEKFITNNERFQKICELLKSDEGTPSERILSIEPTLRALERYQFVASGIEPGPTVTAVQLAAIALAACQEELPQELSDSLAACATSKRQDGEVERMEKIERLYGVFGTLNLAALSPEVRLLRSLTHLVWMKMFQRYYWLKEQHKKS